MWFVACSYVPLTVSKHKIYLGKKIDFIVLFWVLYSQVLKIIIFKNLNMLLWLFFSNWFQGKVMKIKVKATDLT